MNLGMSRADFIDDYFERKFLFRKQAFSDHGVEWKHVNESLFSWDPREGLIHLHKDGLVPLEKYTEPFLDVGLQRMRIVKDIFYDYMRNGATLVLNRLDTKSLLIQRLTMSIARFVGEKAVANGYVAFGGEGTFAKHWDTHDVFAVQLIGRKRWKVFEPTFPLPLPHQKSKEYKHECPAEPVFDGILEAGDILYIPRGWWHEAIPLQNEETLHIAVGIHTAHVADYVAWSCGNALTQLLDFRKTLKFEEDGQQVIRDALACIHEALLDPQNIRAFKEAQVEQERVISAFDVERFGKNHMLHFDTHSALNINSVYRRAANDVKDISVNGLSIKTDSVSANAIGSLFADGLANVNEIFDKTDPVLGMKTERLVGELLSRDVLSLDR